MTRLAIGHSLASESGSPLQIGVLIVPVLAATTLSWLFFVVIWIALAFWPARVAGRKGHSFFGYFILSLFFFPLALVLAYVTGNRNPAPSTVS
jgi:hypothetical protein